MLSTAVIKGNLRGLNYTKTIFGRGSVRTSLGSSRRPTHLVGDTYAMPFPLPCSPPPELVPPRPNLRSDESDLRLLTSVCYITVYNINRNCVQSKTLTYVFDYNSDITWSIFILFMSMETFTLQYMCLMS